MKYFNTIIFILFNICVSIAQGNSNYQGLLFNSIREDSRIEEIYNLQYSHQHYLKLTKQFQKEVERTPQNPASWYNLFKSKKFYFQTDDTRSVTLKETHVLDSVLNRMKKEVGNSFDFYLLKAESRPISKNSWSYIQKAIQAKPQSNRYYKVLMDYYLCYGNKEEQLALAQKWMMSGAFTKEHLQYGKDIMNSTLKNSLLVTNGYLDTYPLIILQLTENLRPDIKILPKNLVKNQAFIESVFKDKLFDKPTSLKFDEPTIIQDLLKQNQHRNIYVSISFEKKLLKDLSSNLYLTGLAYRYSDTDCDNTTTLKKFWKQETLHDYLNSLPSKYLIENGGVNKAHFNYIISAIIVYRMWKETKDDKNMNQISSLIKKLIKGKNNESKIKSLLSN